MDKKRILLTAGAIALLGAIAGAVVLRRKVMGKGD